MTNKPNRRFLRFSLRSLLLLMLVVCVVLGWKVERARKQRVAVAWIKQMGGSVEYDYERDDKGKRIPDAKPPGPTWLRKQLGVAFFADVVTVSLQNDEVSDLSPLVGLTNLKELAMNRTRVSDLSPLAGLTSLELLALNRTLVSDVSPLTGSTRLEALYLGGTPVRDLSPLAGLTRLEVLVLGGTQVSDVSPLAELTNLEDLYLDGTPVTENTVEHLKAALPKCRVVFP